jgi:hypothetical protein
LEYRSGVDIEHEDLKSVIWTNSKEIAGNGIDDDKMDMLMIFGWNFLGDIKENLEYERIIKIKPDEVTYQEAKKINDDKIAQAKAGRPFRGLVNFTASADRKVLRSLFILLMK